jgi:hypothetical protein
LLDDYRLVAPLRPLVRQQDSWRPIKATKAGNRTATRAHFTFRAQHDISPRTVNRAVDPADQNRRGWSPGSFARPVIFDVLVSLSKINGGKEVTPFESALERRYIIEPDACSRRFVGSVLWTMPLETRTKSRGDFCGARSETRGSERGTLLTWACRAGW